MKKKNDLNRVAKFLFEAGTLRKIARAHRQTLLEDDLSDNIASHSYRVALIGWYLAKLENADADKVVMMCLMHDFPEARSNDHNWVHKKYVKTYEEEIIKDQIASLPFGDDLERIISEYSKRESKESKIAKDADLVDQVLLLKEYEHRGNKEATLWLKDKLKDKLMGKKRYHFKTTMALLREIVGQSPGDWWWNIWTNKNRK